MKSTFSHRRQRFVDAQCKQRGNHTFDEIDRNKRRGDQHERCAEISARGKHKAENTRQIDARNADDDRCRQIAHRRPLAVLLALGETHKKACKNKADDKAAGGTCDHAEAALIVGKNRQSDNAQERVDDLRRQRVERFEDQRGQQDDEHLQGEANAERRGDGQRREHAQQRRANGDLAHRNGGLSDIDFGALHNVNLSLYLG